VVRRSELKNLLATTDYDLYCITETWLDNSIADPMVCDGFIYQLFRKDNPDNLPKNGVLVIAKNGLNLTQVPMPEVFSRLNVICLELKVGDLKLRLILGYRIPNILRDENELFIQCLSHFCTDVDGPILLVGDYNVAHIDWNITLPTRPCTECRLFSDFCREQALTQFVEFQTRVNSGTILDLVLTDEPNIIHTVCQLAPFTNSDHFAVECVLNVPKQESHPIEYRIPDFRKAQIEECRYYLANVDWPTSFANCVTAEQIWKVIEGHLNFCVQFHVPPKTVRNKKGKKYPKFIRKMIAERKRLYRRRNTLEGERSYNTQVDRVQTAIKRHEANIELKITNSGNLNDFYGYVRANNKTQSKMPVLTRVDGSKCLEAQEKAELFSEHFASVYTVDDGNVPNFENRVENDTGITEVEINDEVVRKALLKLPNKYSRTPDGFPAGFLKQLAFQLAQPLAYLFNKCQDSGEIPEVWRSAFVVPIFKNKGLRSNYEGYRPVSLTCVIGKLFETILRDGTTNYLFDHRLIAAQQHGFLAKRSVCTSILTALDELTEAIDSRNSVDAIYVDFAKAFDSVSFQKLLLKLEAYGIRGHLLNSFKALLTNRTQQVVVDLATSQPAPVISGTIQGSVCGSLLFLIYINELPSLLQNVSSGLYADDLKIFRIVNDQDASEILQTALETLSEWAELWQLCISIPKCLAITFSNRRTQPITQYHIGNNQLETTNCVRDLGVHIDSKVTMSEHCAIIAKAALTRTKLLLKLFQASPSHVLVRAFTVYVRPILESNTSCWSPYLLGDVERIEHVQGYFTWRIYKRFYYPMESAHIRIRRLGLENLEIRRLRADLCLMYKFKNSMMNVNCNQFFEVGQPVQSGKLRIFASRINARRYNFKVKIPFIWNKLSIETRNAGSLASFKTCLLREPLSNNIHFFHKRV